MVAIMSLPPSPRAVSCSCLSIHDDSARKRLPCSDRIRRVRFELEDNHYSDEEEIEDDEDDDDSEEMTNNPHDSNDNRNQVKCDFGPQRPALSPGESSIMYYDKKEFKEFKKQAKNLAQSTDSTNHAVYIRTFLEVYSASPASASETIDETITNTHYEEDSYGDDYDIGGPLVNRFNLSSLPLTTAPVRGLERYVFPGLVQDQSRVKESVLKAQAKLTASNIVDPTTRAHVLASTSAILSRQARFMARVLGHADSIYALSVYKQTFLPSSSSPSKKPKKKKPENRTT